MADGRKLIADDKQIAFVGGFMGFAFEDLKVYQRAVSFATEVIDAVEQMATPTKHFRLVEQLEAAATSVALNIAEGKGRHSKKEFKHFLYISRGSLYETVAMLQILRSKQWVDRQRYQALYIEAQEIAKMLSGLINSLDATE